MIHRILFCVCFLIFLSTISWSQNDSNLITIQDVKIANIELDKYDNNLQKKELEEADLSNIIPQNKTPDHEELNVEQKEKVTIIPNEKRTNTKPTSQIQTTQKSISQKSTIQQKAVSKTTVIKNITEFNVLQNKKFYVKSASIKKNK